MKIALVVPGGVDRSGEYRVVPAVLALIRRLSARHELHVYALRQEPQPGDWPLAGAQVHNIGGRRALWGQCRAVAAIRAEHRRAPFDLVQALWSGPSGSVAVAAARLLGRPSAVHLAGGELVALADIGYGGRLGWRGRCREAWVLRHADRLTAASAPLLAQLAELGRRGERLPLGVDLDTWPAQPPRPRVADAPLRLIHVASLNRVKDHATLLRAVAQLPARGVDFRLDVVGEDTLHGEVQALAQQLGVAGRTHFHGFLPRGQVWPLMAQADVHVVSSRHEAGPLALLEAAVLGVPSVGTRVGHLAEWAPQAALAVDVGDALALAAALAQLSADEPLRLRLAHEAQQRAVAEDADHTAARMEALHAALVASAQAC